MKKIIITLAALSALSVSALAASDDHGRDVGIILKGKAVSTESLAVQPLEKSTGAKPNYLNWNQLR